MQSHDGRGLSSSDPAGGSAPDGGEVTERGHAFLSDFGAVAAAGERVFCRRCLDWSEGRPHIADRFGAGLAIRCLDLKWIERQRDSRAVIITPAGMSGFATTFAIHLSALRR